MNGYQWVKRENYSSNKWKKSVTLESLSCNISSEQQHLTVQCSRQQFWTMGKQRSCWVKESKTSLFKSRQIIPWDKLSLESRLMNAESSLRTPLIAKCCQLEGCQKYKRKPGISALLHMVWPLSSNLFGWLSYLKA